MTNLATIEKRIGKIETARDDEYPLSHLTDEEFIEFTNNFLVRIDAGFQIESIWDREGFSQLNTHFKQLGVDAEANEQVITQDKNGAIN